MGRGKSSIIHLADFGMAKVYRDKKLNHVQKLTEMVFVGTRLFASPNAHAMITQSRRDDLISLGYCILYLDWFSKVWIDQSEPCTRNLWKLKLATGSLPWRGLKPKNKSDDPIKIIGEAKTKMIHMALDELIKSQPTLGKQGTAFTLMIYGFLI